MLLLLQNNPAVDVATRTPWISPGIHSPICEMQTLIGADEANVGRSCPARESDTTVKTTGGFRNRWHGFQEAFYTNPYEPPSTTINGDCAIYSETTVFYRVAPHMHSASFSTYFSRGHLPFRAGVLSNGYRSGGPAKADL